MKKNPNFKTDLTPQKILSSVDVSDPIVCEMYLSWLQGQLGKQAGRLFMNLQAEEEPVLGADIAKVMWPLSDEIDARGAFRVTAHTLRKTLERYGWPYRLHSERVPDGYIAHGSERIYWLEGVDDDQ